MIHELTAGNVVILFVKMSYKLEDVSRLSVELKNRQANLASPADIFKDADYKGLVAAIKLQPPATRAEFGKAVNRLKSELEAVAKKSGTRAFKKAPIDVTAPFDTGVKPADQPQLMSANEGSLHPVVRELKKMTDIFIAMGFSIQETRLIDDDFHMFESLNFPKDHPARDDYDTFMTEEGLILPAHTSTMQHRVLKAGLEQLKKGRSIAVVIPGRVFRNEDVDSTHEHTFHQIEGVYVSRQASLAQMLGTIQTFLEAYFDQSIEFKTQPFYFPFVEPGLEFLIKRPKALAHHSGSSWLEVMGCGMIHPNVLELAGIDASEYRGFAWGMGVERMVMLKEGIDDIRYFMSGRLDFLKLFGSWQ